MRHINVNKAWRDTNHLSVSGRVPVARLRLSPSLLLVRCLLLAMVLTAALPVVAAPVPDAAAAVVDRLEEALIAAMKAGGEKSFDQRRRDLQPVVDDVLDYERMGRFIFGSQWLSFPETDRKAFIQAFRKLSSSNYAARFKNHHGETFERQGGDSQGDRRARVRSHFIKKNGEAVVFDYLLVRFGGTWRIVNIIVEGVSDLALKRTQYSGIFQESGMSGVIEAMASQERQLENE